MGPNSAHIPQLDEQDKMKGSHDTTNHQGGYTDMYQGKQQAISEQQKEKQQKGIIKQVQSNQQDDSIAVQNVPALLSPQMTSSHLCYQNVNIINEDFMITQFVKELDIRFEDLKDEIEQIQLKPLEDRFKVHQLPLARIKKIMKSDQDVRMISAQAPVIFSKACVMFILQLTYRSWYYVVTNKRRTLQKSDIAQAVANTDIFDFLQDVVPKDSDQDMMLMNSQHQHMQQMNHSRMHDPMLMHQYGGAPASRDEMGPGVRGMMMGFDQQDHLARRQNFMGGGMHSFSNNNESRMFTMPRMQGGFQIQQNFGENLNQKNYLMGSREEGEDEEQVKQNQNQGGLNKNNRYMDGMMMIEQNSLKAQQFQTQIKNRNEQLKHQKKK